MTDRYDAVISRKDKKSDKWRSHKIGAAFPSSKIEGGFNIVLDSLPMPNAEGQAWITLFPAKDKDAEGNRPPKERDASPGTGSGRRDDMNDDIPF
jgi:hypothetical protein